MKDRMAIAVIERAESDGRLLPMAERLLSTQGGVLEPRLHSYVRPRAYRIRIVTSDAFSQEKRDHMRALGADLIEVPSEGGRITKELIEEMIELARQLSDEVGTFYSDQLQNEDAIAGYHPLGEEIWSQTGGRVDAFIQVVGTAHSIAGTATVLRSHNPKYSNSRGRTSGIVGFVEWRSKVHTKSKALASVLSLHYGMPA